MTRAQDLERLRRECAFRGRSLEDLRSWLTYHVQDVLDSDDVRLSELDGLAWGLLSELDRGDIDEDQVRAHLREAIGDSVRMPDAPTGVAGTL